jgi:hypothetical protein
MASNNTKTLCVLTVTVIILFLYYNRNDATYVDANLDGSQYLVRNLMDKEDAANLLAKIKKNLYTLRDYLYKNKDQFPKFKQNIEDLHRRAKNLNISESSPNSKYTSYTVNKGEEMVFCVRSKVDNKLHDINLLMYVAIHEMSHIACPTYGHGPPFPSIFEFFLEQATKIGLYRHVDYFQQKTEYCGMKIG